jgi:RNA polymerase sigma factor (sigma-70 family)
MSTVLNASLARSPEAGALRTAARQAGAPDAHEDGLPAFLAARPRLFGIAYRLLRSTTEAEDIVQDVWVRWQTTDRRVVRNAPAFLATATRRLAINVIQSARSRRETHPGPWLPEPVDPNADPRVGVERSEALEHAGLMLLERLSATERAAYVLREAFDYSYREIANLLRLEEANTRQLVTRARQHVADGRGATVPRRQPSTGVMWMMKPVALAALSLAHQRKACPSATAPHRTPRSAAGRGSARSSLRQALSRSFEGQSVPEGKGPGRADIGSRSRGPCLASTPPDIERSEEDV